MPIPSPRALWLLAAGLACPLLLGPGRAGLLVLGAWDAAVLLLLLLDGWRAPTAALSAERRLREPLTAFAACPVSVRLRSTAARPLFVAVADAPPPGFDAAGHRGRLTAPPGTAPEEARLDYTVTPRARGRHAFGDLHLRVLGPLGLGWRPARLPLGQVVSVYPDLGLARSLATPDLAAAPGPGRVGRELRPGRSEGREFAALRHYQAGDDLRSVDWKATARRGAPVVREWQPERNQTVWVLLDCGRHLGARLGDGRTKLDRAVEAALSLARAAAERGDKTGLLLFGAEVERVVPPDAGKARLGPLAEALHLAQSRPVESDFGAAFDLLLARQRRRALVVIFTEITDPDATAALLARAEVLRRRHLVAVASIADPDLVAATMARPADEAGAFASAAAGRILEEREGSERRLQAAGVTVIGADERGLAAAVVARYAAMKERGLL